MRLFGIETPNCGRIIDVFGRSFGNMYKLEEQALRPPPSAIRISLSSISCVYLYLHLTRAFDSLSLLGAARPPLECGEFFFLLVFR